jgi:hypothetical protein
MVVVLSGASLTESAAHRKTALAQGEVNPAHPGTAPVWQFPSQ